MWRVATSVAAVAIACLSVVAFVREIQVTAGTATQIERAWPGRVLGVGVAVQFGQRLRVVSRDDDRAARDRDRGQRERTRLEGVRVPVEAGRSEPAAAIRRAAHAAARLADVVRGTRPARRAGPGSNR